MVFAGNPHFLIKLNKEVVYVSAPSQRAYLTKFHMWRFCTDVQPQGACSVANGNLLPYETIQINIFSNTFCGAVHAVQGGSKL